MEYNMASASELYPIMAGSSKWFVYGPGNTKVAGPFKSQEEAENYIKSAKSKGASFFKNGADRARLEIQNKLSERGFKVENGRDVETVNVGSYKVVIKDDLNGGVEWQAFRNGQLMAEGDASDKSAAVRDAKKQLDA
jgi:hypothetical protein